MNVKSLITVTKPYTSSIDFQTKQPSTISWASVGEVDTATAREFAIALLNKADELDYAKLGIIGVKTFFLNMQSCIAFL